MKLDSNEPDDPTGPARLALEAYRQLGDEWPRALRGHFAVIVDDRRRGFDVGADAYVLKREFDQTQLLDTVRRLIGRATPQDTNA